MGEVVMTHETAIINCLINLKNDIGKSRYCDLWHYEQAIDEAIEIITCVTCKWISVEDRLPDNKEHDWVLAQVVERNGYMHIPKVMEYRQLKNDWFEETYGWLSEHNGAFTVTHWMPLPEPPKTEKMEE